jgi:hypothetical protein
MDCMQTRVSYRAETRVCVQQRLTATTMVWGRKSSKFQLRSCIIRLRNYRVLARVTG